MRKWGIAVLTAAAFVVSTHLAFAQTGLFPTELTPPERVSVMQRPRPDYSPVGGRIGDFFFYPSAEAEGFWDSNVFYAPHAKSDFYSSLRPGLSVNSDWGANQLNFLAGAEVRRFATQVSENQTNYNLATNGRLDILHGEYLDAGMAFQNAHEERYAPSSAPTQLRPTEYQESSGKLKFVRERGIIGLQFTGNLDYYSYDNVVTTSGGELRESDRNRVEVYGGPKLTYEIVPGYHAFIASQANDRIYQSTYDINGLKRSSHGFEVDVGTDVLITNLITGEIYVGYLRQEYDDSRLPTVSSPGFGGSVLWNVTERTSVRANASRTIEEVDLFGTTAAGTATSALHSSVSVGVEQEVRHNILLTGGGTFYSDDYQGTSRTDNTVEGNLGLTYLLNRMWSAGLDATYQNRTSNTSGVGYSRALIGAKIRLQY
jgi:hypothetical protein